MTVSGLHDKIVLITGANNPLGIGAATARAFARQGATIGLTYLRITPESRGLNASEVAQATTPSLSFYHAMRTKSADDVIRSIRDLGGRAEAYEADLNDPAVIPQIFDWVETVFGSVDVLVNNASHYDDSDTVFTTSVETLDRAFRVNMQAAVLLIAEFVRRYQRRNGQSGRIINLSTDAAQVFAGQIAYGASKAAIEALTRSIAIEVGPLGMTVNTVAPGPVQTGYIAATFEAQLVPTIPLRRIGQPEDSADASVFLASEQAHWLTGQVINVSGGHAL